MVELEFNSGTHYARLRKTIGLLLQRDDWRGQYYKFDDLVDALNILCGYRKDDDNLKEVDTEMIAEAFNLKGECATLDELEFPNNQLTGQDAGHGDGNSRRRNRNSRQASRSIRQGGGDVYIFYLRRHTLAAKNSKKREYRLACVKEGDDKPRGIDGRDGGWSPPRVMSETLLWTLENAH